MSAPLYLPVPFSAALLSVLSSSFSPVRAPSPLSSSSYFFSPTPRRPPSCSCIFCCLLQPRTTVRRESILSRPWHPRVSVATRSCYGQLSAAIAKVLSAGYCGDGGGRMEAGRTAGTRGMGYARKGERGNEGRQQGWRGRRRSRAHPVPGALRVGEKFNPPVKGDDALFRTVQPRR